MADWGLQLQWVCQLWSFESEGFEILQLCWREAVQLNQRVRHEPYLQAGQREQRGVLVV